MLALVLFLPCTFLPCAAQQPAGSTASGSPEAQAGTQKSEQEVVQEPAKPTPAVSADVAPPADASVPPAEASVPPAFLRRVPGKKKPQYVGPRTVVEMPPTPMLDQEGHQREDTQGKPLFNPAVKQQRDKHGNPVFGPGGRPIMQTATDLGFDEKGKKLKVKKEKAPKTVAVAIERGTLTVDGMTGKAGLNYDIKDFRYMYFYAPWIGTTVVSTSPFPGAQEQKNAFNDKTLTVSVADHTIELCSDRRLLGKKPQSAYVAVDRSFQLASKFPVVGYGATLHAPYVWPGSRDNTALKGQVAPPPLPANLRAVSLAQPGSAGQARKDAPGVATNSPADKTTPPVPGSPTNLPAESKPGTLLPASVDPQPSAPAPPAPSVPPAQP